MIVSVRRAPEPRYPSGEQAYSPAESYPEYRHEQLTARSNPVYETVRGLLAQAGLDRERFGSPQWNPLGRFIRPGQSVFVLCNFVYHRRPNDAERDLEAKCTHGSVLRAVIDYVLLATGPTGRVRFGNAALQSCDWNRVLADTGADRVAAFYAARGLPVEPVDLRLFVAHRDALGRVTEVDRRERPGDGVEIDLAGDSLLAELARGSSGAPRFRVADYDPRRIERFHAAGSHRYVIHRAILEADLVLSLPKLKTHEKVGITCGLKGFVGTVGHKDCLAHHRYGPPRIGGDEYSDRLDFLRPLSAFHDWLNRRDGRAPGQGALQIVERGVRRALRRVGAIGGGAWHGNDTAWRMTLDLARIVHYADAAGTLGDAQRRGHLLLIDGIVAGEGNGPLAPTPAPAGTLLFSDHVAAGDLAACRLMGFDPRAVPLLRELDRPMRWPVGPPPDEPLELWLDGRAVVLDALAPLLGRAFRPPQGWRGVLDRAA